MSILKLNHYIDVLLGEWEHIVIMQSNVHNVWSNHINLDNGFTKFIYIWKSTNCLESLSIHRFKNKIPNTKLK
jgi:hypothetical protein